MLSFLHKPKADLAIDLDDNPFGAPSNQPQRDLNNWLANLQQLLPEGDGAVAVAGNRATVTVQWDDNRGRGAAQTLTLVTDI